MFRHHNMIRKLAILGLFGGMSWILPTQVIASTIHYVIVADVNAETIGKDMDVNREAIRAAVINNTPKEMCRLTVLSSKGVSSRRILNAIQNLRVNRDDAIMFYYCGHGAYDENRGTYILTSDDGGNGLFHSTIRDAVQQKGARFNVVILDCCNNLKPLNGRPFVATPVPMHPDNITPLFDRLFLRSNGTLSIISSAKGEYALVYPVIHGMQGEGSSHRGSLYTATLAEILTMNSDRNFDWDQVVQINQRHLSREFKKVCQNGIVPLGDGNSVQQEDQTIVARW